MRTSSDEFAIQAQGLGKQYRIAGPGGRQDTLRDVLAASARSVATLGRGRAPKQSFWALNDVSFDIRHGENVGILGLNGAGKSTLLKVLSRITSPTSGVARINGRMGSLLEVGTGFHAELTGRENIFLYGAILGMSRAEIARKFDAIVEFAEIGDFINTPVKRYSSGMYVRLAFSVAAHLEPDILLLDEVLAVGDITFQRKCIDFAKDLQRRQATILFVSHNMFSIKTMCDRVIYLRQGQVQYDGPTAQGIELYEADCRLASISWAQAAGITDPDKTPIGITDVTMFNEAGERTTMFQHGERMRLRIDYDVRSPVDAANFILAFVRSDGVACCCYNTQMDGVTVSSQSGPGRLELLTPPLSLVSELYKIEILVRERGFGKLVCGQLGGSFHVSHPVLDTHFGVFHEPGVWSQGGRRAVARPQSIGAVS